MILVYVWDWSTRYCIYRRERPSLLYLLSGFGLISDGWLGLYISFGDWANALECWRSPSLRLVIPGIAVPPGVTHSDSHHLWYEHCRKTSTNTNTWSSNTQRAQPCTTCTTGEYNMYNIVCMQTWIVNQNLMAAFIEKRMSLTWF